MPVHEQTKKIFENYKKQTDNSPSSMATLEKKLRLITNTIKDKFNELRDKRKKF